MKEKVVNQSLLHASIDFRDSYATTKRPSWHETPAPRPSRHEGAAPCTSTVSLADTGWLLPLHDARSPVSEDAEGGSSSEPSATTTPVVYEPAAPCESFVPPAGYKRALLHYFLHNTILRVTRVASTDMTSTAPLAIVPEVTASGKSLPASTSSSRSPKVRDVAGGQTLLLHGALYSTARTRHHVSPDAIYPPRPANAPG
ncbi:hypothetical protein C8J57DRAFT_1725021 [Mycena rebaudengoi]|nr:hypothetical protein C8J57DRAFT_1725021 [Mycena rebaudengoi]